MNPDDENENEDTPVIGFTMIGMGIQQGVDFDIVYVDEIRDDLTGMSIWSRFHYLDDGLRPIMEILVDWKGNIWVAGIDTEITHDSVLPVLTKGMTHRHVDDALAKELGEENASEVCRDGLITYVLPRIATLMARCYVPKHPEPLSRLRQFRNDRAQAGI
jgi:hypothetical protein